MIGLDEIRKAAESIRPYLERTPLRESYYFSELCGLDVFLKLENWQPTGSFKVRGAVNFVSSLSPRERMRGVVAWSAGNHGLGVAFASQLFQMQATIFVPETTPSSKLEKFRYFPVEIRTAETYEDCEEEGKAFSEQDGAMILHPYEDWRIIAGAGTTGLEIRESLPEVDGIIVPVGGGGLISGIILAVKNLDPDIRIIAVQSDKSPSLPKSLEDGVCYEVFPVKDSICEGIAGGIGKTVFELAPRLIDEIVLVDEDRIRETIVRLIDHEQLVVEPSSAIAIAALDQIESVPQGSRVVAVLSGGNLSPALLRSLLSR